MKEFFQGLVLGTAVMYGYVYKGTDILRPVQKWFNGMKQDVEHNPRKKEADKMINGFFFRHDGEGKKIVRV
jgi:hypothetical protein